MFHRIIAGLFFFASVTLAPALSAEIKKFGAFYLDIPPDWSATQDEDGLYITVDDGTVVLSFLTGILEDSHSLADVAQILMKRVNGYNLQERKQGQAYSYAYSDPNTGQQAIAFVVGVGEKLICITQIGEHEEADSIIRSIKYSGATESNTSSASEQF